jgi:small GTP-binding protein
MDPNTLPTIRIVLIGDTSVGKSSILFRFADDRFDGNYVITIGVEYREKVVELPDPPGVAAAQNDRHVRLQVWDTAGQERFRTIAPAYYRRALGVMIVFDLTNRKSFDSVEQWLDSLRDHGDPDVVKVLVGNKLDLAGKRKVSGEEARTLASKHRMVYLEVSAKEGVGVDEVFEKLTGEIAGKVKLEDLPVRGRGSSGKATQKPTCC